jgi:hypothetical protein
VFCCDGYRIIGKAAVDVTSVAAPLPPRSLPRAVAHHRKREGLAREETQNWIALTLMLLALAWYWWQLPAPHR